MAPVHPLEAAETICPRNPNYHPHLSRCLSIPPPPLLIWPSYPPPHSLSLFFPLLVLISSTSTCLPPHQHHHHHHHLSSPGTLLCIPHSLTPKSSIQSPSFTPCRPPFYLTSSIPASLHPSGRIIWPQQKGSRTPGVVHWMMTTGGPGYGLSARTHTHTHTQIAAIIAPTSMCPAFPPLFCLPFLSFQENSVMFCQSASAKTPDLDKSVAVPGLIDGIM